MPRMDEDELRNSVNSSHMGGYIDLTSSDGAAQQYVPHSYDSVPQGLRPHGTSFEVYQQQQFSNQSQARSSVPNAAFGVNYYNNGYGQYEQPYSHSPQTYAPQTFHQNSYQPLPQSSYQLAHNPSYSQFDNNYAGTQSQLGSNVSGALQGSNALNLQSVPQTSLDNSSFSSVINNGRNVYSHGPERDPIRTTYQPSTFSNPPQAEAVDHSNPPIFKPSATPTTNLAKPVRHDKIVPIDPPRLTETTSIEKEQFAVTWTPFLIYDSVLDIAPPSGKSDIPIWTTRRTKSGRALVPGLVIPERSTKKAGKSITKKARATAVAKPVSQKRLIKQDLEGNTIASPSAVSTPSSSSEYSSSDEESESEFEDAVEVEKMDDVRAKVKPSDAAEAAAWDVTGIVWRNRRDDVIKADVVAAVPKFQDYIITLREEVKKVTAELSMAEINKKPAAELKKIKDLQAVKRHILTKAIESAVKTGHPMIISHFGSSPKLVMILRGILEESYKLKDYQGPLMKAVLSLLTHMSGMTDALLQRVKFEDLAKRLIKQGDAEIKENINKILASTPEGIAKAQKASEEAAKEAIKQEKIKNGLAIQERARARDEATKGVAAGSKRVNDGDLMTMKPAKRVAQDTGSSSASASTVTKTVPRPGGLSFGSSRPKPAPKPLPGSTTATTVKKQDAPKAAAASTPAPVSTPTLIPESVSAPAPAAPPMSFLGSILTSIANPVPVQPAVAAPPRPEETPEARAKRLRKESRRHLRVRWQEGSALEQVKLFVTIQPEADDRQDDMLTKDAHDDRSEGMRLKQGRVTAVELEDEEEAANGEMDLQVKYYVPSTIDFGNLDESSRKSNFTTRGGQTSFRTPQQETQGRRELIELMAIYTNKEDIPPTPKEPTSQTPQNTSSQHDFGQPREVWLQQRLQEIRYFGVDQAMHMARTREDQGRLLPVSQESLASAQKSQSTTYPPPGVAMPIPVATAPLVLPSVQELLHGLRDGVLKAKDQPAEGRPQHATVRTLDPTGLAYLLHSFAAMKDKGYPPSEPSDWMNEEQKKDWWNGYHRDEAAAKLVADQKAAAELAAQQQAQLLAAMQAPPPPFQAGMPFPFPFPPPIPQIQNPFPPTIHNPFPPAIQNPFPPPIPTITNPFPPPIPGMGYPSSSNNASIQAGQDYSYGNTENQKRSYNSAFMDGGKNNKKGLQSMNSKDNRREPVEATYNDDPYADDYWNADNNMDSNKPNDYQNNQGDRGGRGNRRNNKKRRHIDLDDMGPSDGTGDRYGRNMAMMPPSANEMQYRGKKKPCKFWLEGKCAKGDNCGFLHDAALFGSQA